MAKCDRDCFNCIYSDCVVGLTGISHEDRKEIKERDKRYYNGVDTRMVTKQIPKRARKRVIVTNRK